MERETSPVVGAGSASRAGAELGAEGLVAAVGAAGAGVGAGAGAAAGRLLHEPPAIMTRQRSTTSGHEVLILMA